MFTISDTKRDTLPDGTYESKHATVDTGYSSPACTPGSLKPSHIVLKQSDLVPTRVNKGRHARQPSGGHSDHRNHPSFGGTIGSDTSYENAPRGWRPSSGGLDTSDETYDSNERDELDIHNSLSTTDPESLMSESPRMLSVVSCDV